MRSFQRSLEWLVDVRFLASVCRSSLGHVSNVSCSRCRPVCPAGPTCHMPNLRPGSTFKISRYFRITSRAVNRTVPRWQVVAWTTSSSQTNKRLCRIQPPDFALFTGLQMVGVINFATFTHIRGILSPHSASLHQAAGVFSDLPDDVLLEVFLNLDFSEIIALRQVECQIVKSSLCFW